MTATDEPPTPTTYHPVTKVLHWLTFLALVGQFWVGWSLDESGGGGRGRGRGRGGGSGHGRGRGRGGEDDAEGIVDALTGDSGLLKLHVALGLTILALAVVRLVWRKVSHLPPWDPALSPAERVVEHRVEQVLYACLFAIPITGLWLVQSGDDDLLPLHVATHVAFFVAFAVHLGLVLRHTVVRRDRLVRRML